MDTTLFLTQAFGLFYVIGGVALLMHQGFLRDLGQSLLMKREWIVLGGFLTLILGIPLVLVHNIWTGEVYVLIVTISCWLTFLKGLLRVWFPGYVQRWGQSLIAQPVAIKSMAFMMLLLGLYLCFEGFGM